MEFPRIVHQRDGAYRFIADQAALDAALAEGFVLSRRAFEAGPAEPVEVPSPVPLEPSPDDTPTVAIPVKRKPGRPKKAVTE